MSGSPYPHLWSDAKPGRAGQRRREHHRRDKQRQRREYRIRRANGQTMGGAWVMLPGRRS